MKLLHLYVGVSSPQMNDFSINLTLKGITRRLNHTPRQAAPITPDMLIQFRAHMDISKTLGATIWCAFLIAFYTMARKSNICPISRNAFTPTKHLCRRDIVHNQSGMVVIYKWSKTNQCGQRRHLVTLAPNVTEPVLCPLQAFNNMTRVVPAFAQSPAFLVPDSKRPHKLTTLTHERISSDICEACCRNVATSRPVTPVIVFGGADVHGHLNLEYRCMTSNL